MKKRPFISGFTLLELMTVLAVIVVLTGLVVGVAGLVQNKSAKARAGAEIAMLNAAAEAYKSDNGTYPQTDKTDKLSPRVDFQPTKSVYIEASLDFYRELTGDKEEKPDGVPDKDQPQYLKEFDPRVLKTSINSEKKKQILYFMDPFGLPYGYSTAAYKIERKYQDDLRKNGSAERPQGDEMKGFNGATFDLWSTGGSSPSNPITGAKDKTTEQAKWIKNW